ncbi:hypothetical protein NHX12_003103 [Muraenolepis orangiensis]|uniref:Uncharacterized protein n=1 Tax=Muraenolepis orangiensis TaxID=630683 RepID=A0A9Q0DYC4_9TELE|nr:hypothetical protein NHX12_003103 [Muraenolepis orangiensis]
MVHPSQQGGGVHGDRTPETGSPVLGHFNARDALRGRHHHQQQQHHPHHQHPHHPHHPHPPGATDSPELQRRQPQQQQQGPQRRPGGHGSLTNIHRHESLKQLESPPIRRSTSSGQYAPGPFGAGDPHRGKPLDPETIAQDIEETMNTALNELRELERQSSAKHAPDVVLDTLETQRQGPPGPAPGGGGGGGSSSESLGPVHNVMLRSAANAEASMRRSAGGADALSTFKPTVAPRMGVQLKPPPALRPKPMVLPKTRDQCPGPQPPTASSSPQDPLEKSCTM